MFILLDKLKKNFLKLRKTTPPNPSKRPKTTCIILTD